MGRRTKFGAVLNSLTIRILPHERAKLEKLAQQSGENVSDQVREALRRYFRFKGLGETVLRKRGTFEQKRGTQAIWKEDPELRDEMKLRADTDLDGDEDY